MQPDQTPFLCPAPLGPSNPLFANKIISLQVPTLLSGMAMPPKHLFSSSPSSAFSYPSSSSRKLSRTQKRTEDLFSQLPARIHPSHLLLPHQGC